MYNLDHHMYERNSISGDLSTAPFDSSMGFQYPFVDCT
jgi:hypothetical protein